MATDYPNGVDNFTNPTATDNLDSVTVPHATQHANANDAIEAIEAELGTNPKGTKASVKARLDDVDTELADINDTSISTSLPLTSSGTVGGDNLVVGINATPNDTANYVVQRDANQSFSIGAINFDTTSAQSSAVGKLYWDGNGSLALGLLGGNVTVGINEDLVCYVTNAEATTLNVGEVVYLYGAQGDRPTVKRASNTSDATSAKTFGFVAESIAANQTGFVTIRGTVRKVNTSAFNPGDSIYLGSTAGTFTNVKPSAPNHLVYLGVVQRANAGNGQIQVVVQNGYELDEIHDVSITSETDGQLLVYEASTNLWKNKSISATAPITYDASTRTIAANTGIANGLATLDSTGKVPQSQLPAVAITNTYVVASQAAMLALTAQTGDVAIRTDLSQSFILTADPASTLGNWQQLLSPPDAVTSVDGRVGAVTLTDKYAQLATANTFTGGVQQINTLNASTAGLVIKASASQTENLQVWQNSSASNLVGIGGTGGIFINRTTGSSTTALIMSTGATTSTGIRVDGVAGQTADLQAWRDSGGTVLSNVTASGGFETNGSLRFYTSSARSAWSTLTNTSGNLSFNYQFALTDRLTVTAGAAATVPVTVKGAASATANLTEWQNSAGTVLSSINNAGTLGTSFVTFVGASLYPFVQFSASQITNTARAATDKPLVVKGASGQTADLLQIQDSATNVLNGFDANGNIKQAPAELVQYGAEGSVLQNIPTRVHPAETLLKQAVWWIDSAHSGSSGQAIKNLGWGGAALDATAGSTTSADSNDPRYLEWSGINYVYLPGAANNWLTVPDSNDLDITGDIDIRVQVAMDDWTPSTQQAIIGKWYTGTTSWYLNVTSGFGPFSAGALQFVWIDSGGTTRSAGTNTTVVPFTDGQLGWVRVTLDVDNGSGGNDVRFFTSTDGTTWTQLGSTVTQAFTTSIRSGDSPISMGQRSGDMFVTGNFYRAQVLNGIGGTSVLDVDTSVITTGAATSFTALTGQTVTINRATSGRKTVCVTNPLWLFGTDDYMEVNNRWLEHTGSNYLYLPGINNNNCSSPDSAALDITGDIDIRAKIAMDDWTPSGSSSIVAKLFTSGQFSYMLIVDTNGTLKLFWSADGTNLLNGGSTVATGLADGTVKWIRATLDVDNGASGRDIKFFLSDDGTNWTQLGTTVTQAGTTSIFSGTSGIEIGSFGGGATYISRGKFFRAQVLNGIGGTLAFDANFETGITSNLPTTFTESSANAATVTINYSGTGYRSCGVIASTYVYPGNPNTFKLSTTSLLDFGATDSFTVIGAFRLFATPASFGRLLSKKNAAANDIGYDIETNGTTRAPAFTVANGTANVFAASSTADATTALSVWGGVRDISATKSYYIQNGILSAGTTDTLSGSLANFYTLRVGNAGNGLGGSAAYQDMEFISAAIFRRALTAAEIATLNNYYQGRIA